MRTNVLGSCYLLHFTQPYVAQRVEGRKQQTVQHYLGWSENLANRLNLHSTGHGARLVRVVRDAGIKWHLARVWEDVDRHYERWLKNRKHSSRLCPLCQGTGSAITWVADKAAG